MKRRNFLFSLLGFPAVATAAKAVTPCSAKDWAIDLPCAKPLGNYVVGVDRGTPGGDHHAVCVVTYNSYGVAHLHFPDMMP
jgi:hypothetical protein